MQKCHIIKTNSFNQITRRDDNFPEVWLSIQMKGFEQVNLIFKRSRLSDIWSNV